MSKRKRSPKTPAGSTPPAAADESVDDTSVKEDMVHVTPDLLGAGPDIWTARSGAAGETVPEPVGAPEPPAGFAPPPEPVEAAGPVDEGAAEAPAGGEPPQASTTLEPEPVPQPVEPTTQPPAPPFVTATPYPAPPRRGNTSAVLGVVLIVLGLFALAIVLFGVDLTQYGWPLFVIVPGLTLLVIGFAGMGVGASIPGGIVTMLGLVLAYQNSTGDWPSWAFAWSLVVPFGLGLGIYLQALRDRDLPALRRGRGLMFAGALILMIGFVLFESILGISDRDYGGFGKAALPLLLIVIGIILLVRNIQRSRRAA